MGCLHAEQSVLLDVTQVKSSIGRAFWIASGRNITDFLCMQSLFSFGISTMDFIERSWLTDVCLNQLLIVLGSKSMSPYKYC